jgi:hypothetical protein
MVITELDKAWCRATTAKLFRQGKLKRLPCAVCGARETLVHHIDYCDPERIRWLCKRHQSEERMSTLHRSLLKMGLAAYYRRPLDIACHLPDVGCFELKWMAGFEDRRERARRRAAAGLSIARLIKCGLLECFARGSWRLTPPGLAVARRLYPDLKPPTKRQLTRDIAIHKATSQWADEHPTLSGERRKWGSRPSRAVAGRN